MPGVIQVSVLDLSGLPSASISVISVKVSMGKREHQVWEKGEFSFPVTTLRDNLIVTLCDIEGNELSRTGINTKLVVEKGIWDDLFPLDGGGHLHMKLQFILSEEERKRIREMRETALKKKQDELPINWCPESPAVVRVGHNIGAAFNHEVTDSRESIVQREAVSVVARSLHGHPKSSPVSHDNYPESSLEYGEEGQLERKSPNETDGSERTPSKVESTEVHEVLHLTAKPSEEHIVHHHTEAKQQIAKKTATQSQPNGVLTRPSWASGYSKTTSNHETDGTQRTFSAPIPSKGCNDPHLTEATQKVPVKIDARSPPNEITTRPNSSQNQTHSSISQIAWERTPKINETHKEGKSKSSETSQVTPVKIDTPSTPKAITTRPDASQNHIHNTIKKISLEKTPWNNDTDKEGTSSVAKLPQELEVFHHTKTTQQVMEKTDTHSFSNVGTTRFTMSKEDLGSSTFLLDGKNSSASSSSEQEQTHSADNRTAAKKTPSNVRKMISAFESNLPQGPLPRANSPKMKPHLSKIKTEVSLEGASINEAKTDITETKKQIKQRDLNPYSVRNSTEVNVQPDVSHLKKVKSEVSSKVPSLNEAKMENTETKKQVIERELNPLSVRKPLEVSEQQSPKYVTSQKQVSVGDPGLGASNKLPISQNSSQLEVLDARPAAIEENKLSEHADCNIEHKVEIMSRYRTLLDKLAVTSEADTGTISGRVLHDPVREEHTHTVQQTVEAPDTLPISQSSRQLEVSDARPAEAEGNYSSEQGYCNTQHNRDDISTQEKKLEQFTVISEAETATVSGRIVDDFVSKEHTHTAHHVQQSSVLEKNGWKTYGHDSMKINPDGDLHEQEYLGVEQSHNEVLGSWALPDERSLCITTGSKQMMEFVGCFNACGESSQRENSLSRIGVEKEVALDSDIFVNVKEAETPNRGFGGLVGQAAKIAIMVAFGTLVIVTRQTKNS